MGGGGGLLNEMQIIIATTRYGVITSLVMAHFFSFQRTKSFAGFFFSFFCGFWIKNGAPESNMAARCLFSTTPTSRQGSV